MSVAAPMQVADPAQLKLLSFVPIGGKVPRGFCVLPPSEAAAAAGAGGWLVVGAQVGSCLPACLPACLLGMPYFASVLGRVRAWPVDCVG